MNSNAAKIEEAKRLLLEVLHSDEIKAVYGGAFGHLHLSAWVGPSEPGKFSIGFASNKGIDSGLCKTYDEMMDKVSPERIAKIAALKAELKKLEGKP